MPRPRVLSHMGDYVKHPPVEAFAEVSGVAFELFHTVMNDRTEKLESNRQFLITRLLYISEITSTAIRLNASWALTHAAMSLARDRYEQTVRFSWLARQSDDKEMDKFYASYHSAANKIFRGLEKATNMEINKLVDSPPETTTRPLTPEEWKTFGAWGMLDLLTMAQRRDALPALGKSQMANQALAPFYSPIYRQFSSVTHADMYGVAMLTLHKSPNDEVVLAADPHWPAILLCFNSLFDIIQCFECAGGLYKKDCELEYRMLFDRWKQHMVKYVDMSEFSAPSPI